ncbi:tetratricopeptide repeat protein [Amycolatopsis cihanbeyliensis]|uniref:DNA-binding SARP family transcriptional activator n=1 Tax=Amycolatopsis cihanbeyliensis TaxID=1128664 RepID=A0A542DRQ4_AMYCI|nr:tetratricopeptide repeat protein [Amycolatopsis cihanbeyliensis]TQJ05767.1 DNA-binding SARP family transcriptional activator [Amycolatopsis cihanbeyliensis]
MGDDAATFGKQLRALRIRAGLTQRDLASRTGLSERAVRYLEQGRIAGPRRESMRRLAEAVGLATGEETPANAMVDGADDDQFRIGILGQLEVTSAGAPLALGPMKRRCLFGLLALRPNTVVTHEEIIGVLWGEHPPASCLNLVHTYASGLRKAIRSVRDRPEELIVSTHGGYTLTVGPAELDLLRFDEFAARARRVSDDDPDTAVDLLDQALGCWRAPVLADLHAGVRRHPAAVAVAGKRLDVALAYADLAFDRGAHEGVLERLRPLAHEEPLHEGLHARLMAALAGCGQQAAALRLFDEVRRRLNEELGVGPGAEIRSAHLRIVRDESPVATPRTTRTMPVPAQLPVAVAGFVGREEHLRQLDAYLRPGHERGGPEAAISVITGAAGVGKTALAVHWAHRVRADFPDGQLHVDLRGYARTTPVGTAEALTPFLRALGVPPERVPVNEEEAAGLYRTLLADRRVLVLLDNAVSADQVRPLLPGSPTCAVVITSRDRLSGLVANEGARHLALDVLEPADAEALLMRMLGEQRAGAEPAAVAELVRACAYLPLALRIAGANLTAMPHATIGAYTAELRDQGGMSGLAVEGECGDAVRTTLDLSYARLEPETRRLFRFLGLVPGPDFTADAAAALVDRTGRDVRKGLRSLVNASLLQERVAGRYRFHDLLREYAAECAGQEDSAAGLRAARERLFDFYVYNAGAATSVLYPYVPQEPTAREVTASHIVSLPTASAAVDWLDSELLNIVSAAIAAPTHGAHSYSWRMAEALRDYFRIRGYGTDGLRVCKAALSAARELGDENSEALVLGILGLIYINLSDYQHAIALYQDALVLHRKSADRIAEASALLEIGRCCSYLGEPMRAIESYERALNLNRAVGNSRGEASALNYLGVSARSLGRTGQALMYGNGALRLAQRLDARDVEAQSLHSIGLTNWARGSLDEAREYLLSALEITQLIGHRHGEAVTILCLAETNCDAGRYAEAEAQARDGMEQGRELGERRHEIIGLDVLAKVNRGRGQHADAMRRYRVALRLAREFGDRYNEISVLHGLVATCRGGGQPSEAVAYGQEALIKIRSTAIRLFEGSVLTELAHTYLDIGDLKRAAEYVERGFTIALERGQRLAAARSLHVSGLIERAAGRLDIARDRWRAALEIYVSAGGAESADLQALLDASSG